MAGIYLMNGCTDDRAGGIGRHVLFGFFGGPSWLGQGDFEESLFGLVLVSAGRFHSRLGSGAFKGRSLADDGQFLRWNCDDVMLLDKRAEIGECVLKC